VGRNGLSHRCLPYQQRWIHWVSVNYVKKTWWVYLYFSVKKFGIRYVIYLLQIFKMFHGLMNNPVQWEMCAQSNTLLSLQLLCQDTRRNECQSSCNVHYL
jgi:hypothetical protein